MVSYSNTQPQSNEFKFDTITFTSKFDSGNLLNVEQISHDEVC